MTCPEELVLEIFATATIKIFKPIIAAVVDVRDKNIKERISGVDPLQKQYIKK